jgi:hypothetical protein
VSAVSGALHVIIMKRVRMQRRWCSFLLSLMVILGLAVWHLSPTGAFNGRDLVLLNVVFPMLQAGYKAHRHGKPVGQALLQGAAGGLLMQKGFETAADARDGKAWTAWRAKILMNLGASLCESAGDQFRFRMDVGPVWILAGPEGIQFRPGLHSTIAPLLNLSEGARLDLGRSLRFGTLTFDRPRNSDGTIGRNGALAYSNANNFITDQRGNHIGHELIHTFQYRRDAFLMPRLGRLIPEVEDRLGQNWVDDTGWFVNWASQCRWADWHNKSRDFDIPLEKEAYYLADGVH